jgi:predicted metalloprotease
MATDPKNTPKGDSSFLGGGPKFNQAGFNTPMPGERTADAAPGPKYGGPRLWAGVVIAVILIVVLWLVYANGPGGVETRAGRQSTSMQSAPSANPDQPESASP